MPKMLAFIIQDIISSDQFMDFGLKDGAAAEEPGRVRAARQDFALAFK